MPSIILSDNGVSSGSAGLKSTAASDGALALQTTTAGGSATTAVSIDTSQNVGIGVSSPVTKLDVSGPVAINGSLPSDLTSRLALEFSGSTASFSSYGATAGTGLMRFITGGGGGTGGSVRMTLDANGKLLVGGTTSDLSATTQAMIMGSGGFAVQYTGTTGTLLQVVPGAANGTVDIKADARSGSYPAMTFYTSATERARIDSSGRLLVGTTSALNSTANLSVFNTSGGSSGGLSIGYGSGAAANRWIYLISANGSLYFESSANAASLNSAGAWTNASDARLKNSITDIKYGLSAVLSAQPRSYKMNDLEGDYIGFVAQELQTVIPEVVSGDPEKQLGVDYGSLVAVAFKAIQELKAELDTAKAEIAILQGAQQ